MSSEPPDRAPTESRGRAKDLFLDALDLEGDAQREFLRELAEREPELYPQVRSLMEAHLGASWIDDLPSVAQRLRDEVSSNQHQAGTLVGDYELLEEVAHGASGVVWRVRQRSLDRVVALKLLRAGRFAGERELARFRAEAGAVARLDHPHIVPVYETGAHEGHAFFSMKWVEGGSLAEALESRWEPESAALLVARVARAVHHAHQRGILHRDLKPSNVLLDEHGEPHVADFGVAKRIDVEETRAATQGLAGTPAYMAPEQVGSNGELTVATDVWGLGCILHETLAGEPAFSGSTFTELLVRIRDGRPSPLRAVVPDVPRDLETIVLVCLARDPADRYASAQALSDDLERWLAHEPIQARRASVIERSVLMWRRSPVVVGLGFAVAMLVLALVVGAVWSSFESRAMLRDSWREQARSTRLSGVPGRRGTALELVARAAELRPGPDLRDEAVACLALTDLSLEREWPRPVEDGFACDFDGDMRRFAWASLEGEVRVERTSDQGLIESFTTPDSPEHMRFSRDGTLLAVKHRTPEGASDVPLRVWDVDSGALVLEASARVGYHAFDIGPRNRLAAHVSLDGELVQHDLHTGSELLRMDIGARAGCLRFSPDGTRVAMTLGGDVREIQVRSSADGALLDSIPLPRSSYVLDWDGNGERLFVSCTDYKAYVWRVGDEEFSTELEGHQAEVVRALFAPDGEFGVTYSWDGTTRIWDTRSGEELSRVSAYPVGLSDDGERLGLLTNESVSVWDLEHGQVLRVLRAHEGKSPRHVSFSSDGARLVSAGPDGAFLWNAHSGVRLAQLSDSFVDDAHFLPGDAGLLLSGRQGLELRSAHDLLSSELLYEGATEKLGVSADGSVVATAVQHEVHVFHLQDQSRNVSWPKPAGLTSLRLSPDATRVAGLSWRAPGVHVWDARTGERLGHLLTEHEHITLEFSPDGSEFVTGTPDSFAVWDTDSLSVRLELERQNRYGGKGAGIAYHPDGELLAVVDLPGMVTWFELRSGRRLATLEAPTIVPLNELSVGPKGERLAATSTSNVVQLWNLAELERQLAAMDLELH